MGIFTLPNVSFRRAHADQMLIAKRKRCAMRCDAVPFLPMAKIFSTERLQKRCADAVSIKNARIGRRVIRISVRETAMRVRHRASFSADR
jgi:hypothetical protein